MANELRRLVGLRLILADVVRHGRQDDPRILRRRHLARLDHVGDVPAAGPHLECPIRLDDHLAERRRLLRRHAVAEVPDRVRQILEVLRELQLGLRFLVVGEGVAERRRHVRLVEQAFQLVEQEVDLVARRLRLGEACLRRVAQGLARYFGFPSLSAGFTLFVQYLGQRPRLRHISRSELVRQHLAFRTLAQLGDIARVLGSPLLPELLVLGVSVDRPVERLFAFADPPVVAVLAEALDVELVRLLDRATVLQPRVERAALW